MKFFILLFLLSAGAVFAQRTNPDGNVPSLHITPFVTGGDVKYDGQKLYDYKRAFGFEVKLKIPIMYSITLSAFFENNNLEFDEPVNAEIFANTKINVYKIGATLSFYLDFLR